MKIFHEVADIFPMMDKDQFSGLVEDIKRNGQLMPIWLHPDDGTIVDGRNRYNACLEASIEPHYKTWSGVGSLVAFVVALNFNRRHLSKSQKAVTAIAIKEQLQKEIAIEKSEKDRVMALKREAEKAGRELDEETKKQALPLMVKPARDATKEAAKIAGVSKGYIITAQKLKNDAPDLFQSVASGEMPITKASRELTKRNKKATPPLPTDKYRILYADPPWEYGNSGVIGDNDNYGHVARHYPSMSIGELCSMGGGVKDMMEKNSILFLWATSPLLEDAFLLIKAWGYKYKTSFIWDKIKHNFGHYNSVRHELLLICTRGSCTPDNLKLFDSVQSIERTKKHSEKPNEFRDIIDTLYTHGNKLEMFARCEVDGWDSWGNDV